MRTKTVWPTREIASVWLYNPAQYGRNPQGNLYFDGDTIYSYGGHFPICKRVKNQKGDVAYLYNPAGYSNTTSRHQSMVWMALHGRNVFEVYPNQNPNQAIPEYQSRIDRQTLSALRARSNAKWKVETLRSTLQEANTFARFFELGHVFKIKPEVRAKFEKLMILWGLRGEL